MGEERSAVGTMTPTLRDRWIKETLPPFVSVLIRSEDFVRSCEVDIVSIRVF